MNSIIAMADVLSDTQLTPQQVKYVQVSSAAARICWC